MDRSVRKAAPSRASSKRSPPSASTRRRAPSPSKPSWVRPRTCIHDGETVLQAMIALGRDGPQRAQGRTVARVVKALAAVGLNEEARAIAIEAVLGAPSNVHS